MCHGHSNERSCTGKQLSIHYPSRCAALPCKLPRLSKCKTKVFVNSLGWYFAWVSCHVQATCPLCDSRNRHGRQLHNDSCGECPWKSRYSRAADKLESGLTFELIFWDQIGTFCLLTVCFWFHPLRGPRVTGVIHSRLIRADAFSDELRLSANCTS